MTDLSAQQRHSVSKSGRSGVRLTLVAAAVGMMSAFGQSPHAVADSVDNLRAAIAGMRGSACPALRSDATVEAVAVNVNDSSIKWLNHTARAVPIPDPLPVLKELGYAGGKATMIQGAGQLEANALKGLLLQGWDKVPDCSYTDFGASVVRDGPGGFVLMVVVLAGP